MQKIKKICIIIAALTLIAALAAGCTSKTNNISSSLPTQSESVQDTAEDTFKFTYQGKDVSPKTGFSQDSIPLTAECFEVPGCAFEETDNVYQYEDVEITTTKINGKEIIYQVVLLNDTLETAEGIKISDELSKVTEVYGDDYEELANGISYTKDKIDLLFIVENDAVTSIVYSCYDLD